MMPVPYVFFITVAAVVTWWLSGYDAALSGDDTREDYIRRGIRCGITLVLLTMAAFGGYLAYPIFVIIGIIWAGPGAEFGSRQFHKLLDPDDDRPFDPKEIERTLDRLGAMVRQGRYREALEFCGALEQSGKISPLILETTIHRLYQETLASTDRSPFLADIRRWREQKQFNQAEAQLKDLIARQPENWGAMLLLMRVYAEDLSQPHRALALLQADPRQPQLPAAFARYARESIHDWSSGEIHAETNEQSSPARSQSARQSGSPAAAVEISIDDLLNKGRLATAIEHLEHAIKEQPQDFDLWLKLAEAYAVYCADPNRAGKIIRKMENSARFAPEQIDLANSKLKEWRNRRRS